MDAAKKRQIIILSVAAIAVLYGLYDLTIGSRVKHTAPDVKMRAEELRSFVAQTAVSIGKEVPSPYDMYIIRRAESMWGRNPFFQKARTESTRGPKDNAPGRSLFVYEGYIEAGGRDVAVINGNEYIAGEPLQEEGFLVKKISPSSVIILNRKEGTEFAVPLAE